MFRTLTIFTILCMVPMLSVAQAPFHAPVTKPSLQKSSLYFIENKGQVKDEKNNTRNDIDLKIHAGNGLDIFIGNGQLHYQWNKTSSANPTKEGVPPVDAGTKPLKKQVKVSRYRMDVELVGANKSAVPVTELEQNYYETYFLSGFGSDGVMARTFKKVTYKNVYPNIDWVLYFSPPQPSASKASYGERLEYDFVVRPGGNVKDIKLRYGGSTGLERGANGGIQATTPMGIVNEKSPNAFEQESGAHIEVSFILKDSILSFNIAQGAFDAGKTLVIDPELLWSTYFGGNQEDDGYGVATDASGNVFMGGNTYSNNNIVTAGSYQSAFDSGMGGYTFITKFNSAGTCLWGSYYYGINGVSYWYGNCKRIACDPSGNVFITGTVFGSNLAAVNAYQSSCAGDWDAYLAKINSSGSSVLWATFFGGAAEDIGEAIACDLSGNVYMLGSTQSTSGIASTSSYQTSIIGTDNYFLTKFNSSGSMQWGTYFGGDCGYNSYVGGSVTCDAAGNVFISGSSCATSNVATAGAYQTTLGGGLDAFLAKFNSSGAIQWSTYFGGSNPDYGGGLACDNNNNIYLAGYTSSISGIATAGAYQTTFGGALDAYLAKFDPGGALKWSTYFGGGDLDWAGGVTCNSENYVYIGGVTQSASGIATAGTYQSSLAGQYDAYMAKFDSTGMIQYGTYYGGAANDAIFGLYRDPNDYIYMCGWTASTSNIATPGAHQTTYGGGTSDAFLGKWDPDTTVNILYPIDTVLCPGDTLHLSFFTTKPFHPGNIFRAQLSDATGNFASGTIVGTDATTTNGTMVCTIPANAVAGSHYRLRIIGTSPIDTSIADTANIRVKPIPYFGVVSNSPVCYGRQLLFGTINTFSPATYHWSGPNNFSSTNSAPSKNSVSYSDSGDYYVTDMVYGCVAKDTIHISVIPSPTSPTASSNTPCAGDTLRLYAGCTNTGANYMWTGPGAYYAGVQDPLIPNAQSGTAGTYTAIITLTNGCADTISFPVTVSPLVGPPTISLNSSPDTICPGGNAVLTAIATNAGAPVYKWYKNGAYINSTTSPSFTIGTAVNGDIVSCTAVSNTLCQPVDTAASNSITLFVAQFPPPVINSITTYPLQYSPGATMTFTGHVPNSNGYSYQWRKNGADIPGATFDVYTSSQLHASDTICLIVHSSVACTIPDSTIACVDLAILGTNNLQTAPGSLRVFPNPFTDKLVIEGIENGSSVKIFDIVGQVVYSASISNSSALGSHGEISINTSSFCKGTYILEITDAGGERDIKKIVK